MQGDGVDTQFVLRAAGAPSPFTYIIVDRQGRASYWRGLAVSNKACAVMDQTPAQGKLRGRDWTAAWVDRRRLARASPPAFAGGTRTCIHTPGEPMQPEELTPELAAAVLDGAALVYFDGRLTEAALVLAAAARERAVPVLVEAERLRPGGRSRLRVVGLLGNHLWHGASTLRTAPPHIVPLQAWSSCWAWRTMWSAPHTSRRAGRGSSAWGTPCWPR